MTFEGVSGDLIGTGIFSVFELLEDIDARHVVTLRLPHTSRFFVAELQIFCRARICRDISLPHTSRCFVATNRVEVHCSISALISASISAMLKKTLVHVTLMTIPNWLRRARAPTKCLGSPHTSRQGPTRRFEI